VGWGHSRVTDAVDLARTAGARRLVTFHHDPAHNDETLDAMLATAHAHADGAVEVLPGREGETFSI
jgi:ribonuclease BN (tRNA processing enzyme)